MKKTQTKPIQEILGGQTMYYKLAIPLLIAGILLMSAAAEMQIPNTPDTYTVLKTIGPNNKNGFNGFSVIYTTSADSNDRDSQLDAIVTEYGGKDSTSDETQQYLVLEQIDENYEVTYVNVEQQWIKLRTYPQSADATYLWRKGKTTIEIRLNTDKNPDITNLIKPYLATYPSDCSQTTCMEYPKPKSTPVTTPAKQPSTPPSTQRNEFPSKAADENPNEGKNDFSSYNCKTYNDKLTKPEGNWNCNGPEVDEQNANFNYDAWIYCQQMENYKNAVEEEKKIIKEQFEKSCEPEYDSYYFDNVGIRFDWDPQREECKNPEKTLKGYFDDISIEKTTNYEVCTPPGTPTDKDTLADVARARQSGQPLMRDEQSKLETEQSPDKNSKEETKQTPEEPPKPDPTPILKRAGQAVKNIFSTIAGWFA